MKHKKRGKAQLEEDDEEKETRGREMYLLCPDHNIEGQRCYGLWTMD